MALNDLGIATVVFTHLLLRLLTKGVSLLNYVKRLDEDHAAKVPITMRTNYNPIFTITILGKAPQGPSKPEISEFRKRKTSRRSNEQEVEAPK